MTSFTTTTKAPSSPFWTQPYTIAAPSHPGLHRPTRQEQASSHAAVQPGSVTLTYRGQPYQSLTYLMAGVEMKVKSVYRGVPHQLDTFCACQTSDRPQRTLYYRGVPYVQ